MRISERRLRGKTKAPKYKVERTTQLLFVSGAMYGRSSVRLRGSGSDARRLGVLFCDLLSTLPEGRPFPWTASTSILVISWDSVRCSIAARLFSDSFNSLGT